MRWSSAVSSADCLVDAVAATAADVLRGLGGESPDLVLAFVSRHFATEYDALPALLAGALPPGVLLGCSAGGVIGAGREVEQRPGLSLTAARLPDVGVTPFTLEGSDLPDGDAGPRAWHAALGVPPEPKPQFVLLADPYTFPAAELLAGLDYAYPRSVKVGGLASGAGRPGGNAIYAGRRTLRAGLAGVALRGDISLETIVAQGCRPVGPQLRITRCDGNILHELEGRAPLRVLQDLLAELPAADRDLAAHALFLGVGPEGAEDEPGPGGYLIRNLVGIDPRLGALAVGEALREGMAVRFHVRDAATSAEDLDLLLDRCRAGGGAARARGALLFSCLGRGVNLYGRADHDTDAFRARIGDLALGGFFCNGEIGPVAGVTRLHGYTSAFGLFGPARP